MRVNAVRAQRAHQPHGIPPVPARIVWRLAARVDVGVYLHEDLVDQPRCARGDEVRNQGPLCTLNVELGDHKIVRRHTPVEKVGQVDGRPRIGNRLVTCGRPRWWRFGAIRGGGYDVLRAPRHGAVRRPDGIVVQLNVGVPG
eukprot:1341193-Prymnesium_polylepis.1